MNQYDELAKFILDKVGGIENIKNVNHCITRLRFQLHDESLCDSEALNECPEIVSVVNSNDQYQIVIGTHVPSVFVALEKVMETEREKIEGKKSKGFINFMIGIISFCFKPFFGIMCASGIIKGVNTIFVFAGFYSVNSGAYLLLNSIGDSAFYFLPVFVGYTSAKRFGLNPLLGIVIGASLCYPTIQLSSLDQGKALGTIFGIDYYTTILNFPVLAGNYVESVFPVIIATALGARIEKKASRIFPETITNFLTPFTVLIICLPVILLFIGPITIVFTKIIEVFFQSLSTTLPIMTGAIIGFSWQILVIFGLHWSVMPLALLNMQTLGYDQFLVATFTAAFAQCGALLAMYFKLKDRKLKALVIPAFISAVFGVTEPSIYGLTLPEKKPFICSLFGAACGGAFMIAMNVKLFKNGGLGIFRILDFADTGSASINGIINGVIGIVIAMIISFVLTMLVYEDKTILENPVKLKFININSPIEGMAYPLTKSHDEVFSSGLLGQGVLIIPSDGKVYSPVDGRVTVFLDNHHAIGITADCRLEFLIHIGIDTIRLNGEGFIPHVKIGDRIKKGQLLLEFDMNYLIEHGKSIESPFIITNPELIRSSKIIDYGKTSIDELIFEIEYLDE